MKKIYLFLFNLSILIWLEGLFGFVIFDSYLKTSILSIFLFLIPLAIFNTIITSLFKEKVNFIIGCILYGILAFYFSLQIIFKQVFETFFQLALFSLGDQILAFGKQTILSILSNIHYVILSFIPLIIFIVFRKKIGVVKAKLKSIIILVISLLVTSVILFMHNTLNKDTNTYKLIYKLNDNSQSIQHLGVVHSLILDIGK